MDARGNVANLEGEPLSYAGPLESLNHSQGMGFRFPYRDEIHAFPPPPGANVVSSGSGDGTCLAQRHGLKGNCLTHASLD